MSAVSDIMGGKLSVIFSGCDTPEKIKRVFNTLVKEVHPDRCADSRAADAFDRLVKFVDALTINPNHTEPDSSRVVITLNGAKLSADIIANGTTDGAGVFVTPSGIVTRYDDADRARNHVKMVTALRDLLVDKNKLTSYREVVPTAINTDDADVYTARRRETASLRRVVDAWGPWDPRHAAWLASCLLDFSCLMDNQKIVHLGLTPDNVFVDLGLHSVQVLGGWSFTTGRGKKITALPAFVHRNAPARALAEKRAVGAMDVAAAKALVRLALGKNFDTAPPAFKTWVCAGVDGDPVSEYKRWESARETAFGLRKFVKHDRVAADAYKEK